ncbi:MAG: leucine-rich repeat protein, partial [Clostridiales bacterium]|nr:leucine-rich repeat protein [Clostridiales bacterium]
MKESRRARLTRRALSFVLTFSMLIALMPAYVFANDDSSDVPEQVSIEEPEAVPSFDEETETVPVIEDESEPVDVPELIPETTGEPEPEAEPEQVAEPEPGNNSKENEYLEERIEGLPFETLPARRFESSNYNFTIQPKSGYFDPGTLTYTINWKLDFNPRKIEIWGGWHIYDTITYFFWGDYEGSYTFHINVLDEYYNPSEEYVLKAYYYLGDYDAEWSYRFTVSTSNLKFTSQPKTESTNLSTLKTRATWNTSFAPMKVEIEKLKEVQGPNESTWNTYEVYDTLTTYLSTNGHYDFPLEEVGETFRITAYYGADSDHLHGVSSEPFEVTSTNLGFVFQPEDGFYDPDTGNYQVTWMTNFTPVKVRVCHAEETGNMYTYTTLYSDLSDTGRCDINRNNARKLFCIAAYNNDHHCIYSKWFRINNTVPTTTGTCGKNGSELTWSYKEHILYISGNGYMADYTEDTQPWKNLRSNIKMVVLNSGVKSVGNYAFSGCLGLTVVCFPETLQSIGNYAFNRCNNLGEVRCSFPEFDADKISWDRSRNYNLLKAAWQYTVRAEGTCGDHMTWVLYGDNSLVIQGSGDMYNWSSASEVPWYKYRNDIVSVGSTFSGDVSIGQYAFAELKKLESYTIPPNVSKIGEHAFEGSGLKTVKFWDDVHDDLILSDYCFRNCKSLQSFTIPKTVKKIGNYTFANCTALTEITFATGSALKSIGNAAFYECKQLNNISFPNSVTKIGSNAFYGCRSFTSLTLPSSLTSMGAYAFQNCSGITGTIEIPSGVTSIPSYAFMDCSQFSFLSFGSNVTSIGTGAFANCTNLYRVDFDGFLSQWNKITIGLRNDDLTSAHIQYLYKHGNLSSTITYTIKGGSGEVEINGYGDLADYQMPWYQYAEHIETIYISGSIKSIGAENFRGCTNVSKVYLPGSLEAVGARAFNDCKNLTDVYFDGILSDWEDISIATGNVPLTNATIHTGVVSGNVGGTDIYWSLNDEGTLTLYFDMDCSDTDMPNFRDDRQQPWYEYQDRIYRIRISEGVTYIGNEAFSCLSNLEEVEIPSSVTKMGDSCFSYCYSLDSFTFPDTVTSIGGGMFFKCDNLQTVHLPAGLTEIPVSMFSYCGTLNKVYMPSTVTSIGNYAFPGDTDFAYTGYLYYDGTSTQWSKISIGSTGNDALKTANICFIVPELAISEKNFPDANFRAYLKEKIDTDKTGWLTDAERLAVKDISCTGRSIGSLKGIAHFPNLETLNCANNLLQGELVLSENLKLTEVHCGENESLESINIEGLNKLTIFDCHGDSNLSSLDLSTNYALRKLDVSNCQLSSLDVSKNAELNDLACNYNNLNELNLSRNLVLFHLYCYTNHLTNLDLSHCTFLEEVDCADNDLTLLYLGDLRYLRVLRTEMNAFLTLDVADCQKIRNCVRNSDTNVQYIEGMVSYELDNCVLTVDDDVLVISDFSGIYINEANFPDPVFREYVSENFDIDKNGRLIPLELEKVTKLELSDGDITNLKGIEHFPKLKTLTVAFSCDLTELDLSGNPDLENLVCMACGIEELDLRANKRLTELDCNDNPLVSLNVSGLTELKYIDASYCSLTELDVSDCTLTDLFCYAGPLKSLKLGNQPNLKRLDCYYSDLSQLDISRCPLLINAWNNGTHTEKSDGVIDISLAPQVRYMAFDNDVEVTVEHDGVAITTDNFPDDVFRAYVTEEFDEDINGWLSDSEIEAVTFIEVSDMNIQSLKGIEFFVSIAGLNVSDNDLTNLDLRKNTELRYLSCRNNSLITLNLTENKKLEALESDGMKSLVAVYVSGLTHLNAIDVSDCGITVLDVSSCPLMYLACDRNPLTSLILGKQPDLDSLTCYSVELIELDISECPHLVNAWLNGNHTEYEWGLEVSLAEEGYMEIDSSVSVTLPAFVEITSQPESISGQIGEE